MTCYYGSEHILDVMTQPARDEEFVMLDDDSPGDFYHNLFEFCKC